MAKNRKRPKSRRKQNNNLPLAYRERGIYTRRQLVAALLPYMEWVAFRDLRTKVEKILPGIMVGAIGNCIDALARGGFVEKKYGETAATHVKESPYVMKPYLYVRRISRQRPPCNSEEIRATGMYGLKSAQQKARAQMKGKKKAPNKTVTTLTVADWKYIRDNPHGTSVSQTADMFNQEMNVVQRIRKHCYVPEHLKEQLSLWLPLNNPAET